MRLRMATEILLQRRVRRRVAFNAEGSKMVLFVTASVIGDAIIVL